MSCKKNNIMHWLSRLIVFALIEMLFLCLVPSSFLDSVHKRQTHIVHNSMLCASCIFFGAPMRKYGMHRAIMYGLVWRTVYAPHQSIQYYSMHPVFPPWNSREEYRMEVGNTNAQSNNVWTGVAHCLCATPVHTLLLYPSCNSSMEPHAIIFIAAVTFIHTMTMLQF